MEKLPAAPTVIVGLGPTGKRIAGCLGERLLNSSIAQASMLAVVDGSQPSVLAAIERLTRQRTVLFAERKNNLRSPSSRYLKLQLILIANISEVSESFFTALQIFIDYEHPAEGVAISIALDASDASRINAVCPQTEELLKRVEAIGHKSPTPTQIILAHRLLMDGTHLDHPNIQKTHETVPDEFELLFSRLLEAYIREHDVARKNDQELQSSPVYRFVGGGSAVFPRELLLASAASLLGAQLLERTAKPPDEGRVNSESICPSRSLLFEWTAGELQKYGVTIERRQTVPKDSSLFSRYVSEEPNELITTGVGVSVRGRMNNLSSASIDEFAESYEAVAAESLDKLDAEIIPALNRLGPLIAAKASKSLRERVDQIITTELGGIDLAERCLSDSQDEILQSLMPAEGDVLREVPGAPWASFQSPTFVSKHSEEFHQSTPDLLSEFRASARKLPGPAALLMRGALVGAMLGPTALALGIGQLGFWIGSGLALGGFTGAWIHQRAKLDRMRLELLQRLDETMGERVYHLIQDQLGGHVQSSDGSTPELVGVLPLIWRYIETIEKPLVRGFKGLHQTGIELMRRIDGWPDGYVTGADWLDLEDPWKLFGHKSATTKPSDITDQASKLLLSDHLFQDWRSPSFPDIEEKCSSLARTNNLEDLEQLSFGQFFKLMSSLYDSSTPEETHALRVWERMNLLALRCVPFAPHVAEANDDTLRNVLLHVPESIDWLDAQRVLLGEGDHTHHVDVLAQYPAADIKTSLAWLGFKRSAPVESATSEESTVLEFSDRRALLVGMSDYPENPLPKAISDCDEVTESLVSLGFAITRLNNVGLTELVAAVTQFTADVSEKTLVFFIFTGHGSEIDGANFLSCVKEGAYNVDRLFDALKLKGSTNIIVLDCCRVVRHGNLSLPLKRSPAPPNTVIAYATTESVEAYDGIYAPILAQELLAPNKQIEDIFKKVRRRVVAKSRGKQRPWEESSLEKSLILNRQVKAPKP